MMRECAAILRQGMNSRRAAGQELPRMCVGMYPARAADVIAA
jgi:hypothetical protein